MVGEKGEEDGWVIVCLFKNKDISTTSCVDKRNAEQSKCMDGLKHKQAI